MDDSDKEAERRQKGSVGQRSQRTESEEDEMRQIFVETDDSTTVTLQVTLSQTMKEATWAMKKRRRKTKLLKTAAVHRQTGGHPVLSCPLLCNDRSWRATVVYQRHRSWASRRRFRLCVSSWSRSWCARATDHGGFR